MKCKNINSKIIYNDVNTNSKGFRNWIKKQIDKFKIYRIKRYLKNLNDISFINIREAVSNYYLNKDTEIVDYSMYGTRMAYYDKFNGNWIKTLYLFVEF